SWRRARRRSREVPPPVPSSGDGGRAVSVDPGRIRMLRSLFALLACLAWVARVTAAPAGPGMPPTEDGATERLNSSPRHGELRTVDVRGTPVRVWVVYPERKDKAPVVVVIHEISGLTDWIRALTEQLAA